MYKDYLTFIKGETASNNQKIVDKTLEREINLARKIQTQLLNGKIPTFEGGELAGSSLPARLIGGDYYDFYPLVNGKIRMVIGDVMGKGIPAAMLMILTRGAFRSAAESTNCPAETLRSMNQALYEDLRTLKSFVTLICADYDPKTGIFTYANAGHLLPLYMNGKDKSIEELPKVSGVMLGGIPNQVYNEISIQLNEQDIVFIYTDGIVEAQNKNGEQYKLERLIQTLLENHGNSVSDIEKSVMDSVRQFTQGVPQKDDITMVLLKVSKQKSDINSIDSLLMN